MFGNKYLIGWAKNRTGIKTTNDELPHFFRDSLEQNNTGKSFTDTFGQKEFEGIVGFIDLKGYSIFSEGKSAREIAKYVKPFLTSIIKILTEQNSLIDKTIGDEIMFFLPSIEGGFPVDFDFWQILRKIKDFALENSMYKFRMGISVGKMYLDVISTNDYSEWFISGEPIIAAKRIMSTAEMENLNPCIAAICLKEKDKKLLESFCNGIVSYQPCNWVPDGEIKNNTFKGIGNIIYQLITIKT